MCIGCPRGTIRDITLKPWSSLYTQCYRFILGTGCLAPLAYQVPRHHSHRKKTCVHHELYCLPTLGTLTWLSIGKGGNTAQIKVPRSQARGPTSPGGLSKHSGVRPAVLTHSCTVGVIYPQWALVIYPLVGWDWHNNIRAKGVHVARETITNQYIPPN